MNKNINMTPKDKAIELIQKYTRATWIKYDEIKYLRTIPNAKECALIAVDELIYSHSQDTTDNQFYFWQEVKKEIQKL